MIATREPPRTARSCTSTIDRIADAAEAEFATAGFELSRIQDIADRAGLSKQVVYHYFGTKEKLYAYVLDKISDFHVLTVVSGDYEGMSPVRALSAYVSRLFDAQLRHKGQIMVDVAMHKGVGIKASKKLPAVKSAMIDCLEAIIERGKAESSFSASVDARRLFFMINLITNGCISSGEYLGAVVGLNFETVEEKKDWRLYCIEFILKAVRPDISRHSAAEH